MLNKTWKWLFWRRRELEPGEDNNNHYLKSFTEENHGGLGTVGNFLVEEKRTRITNLIFRGSKQILWSLGASSHKSSLVTLKIFSLGWIFSNSPWVVQESRGWEKDVMPDATLLTISNKRRTGARQNTNDDNNNWINLIWDLGPPIT